MTDVWKKRSFTKDDTPVWDWSTKELVGVLTNVDTVVTKLSPQGSKVYTFELKDGSKVKVWGKTAIDNQISTEDIGIELKIVSTGPQINPKSGRTFKGFDVYGK